MSAAALLSLQQALRRSFQALRSGHEAWRSVLAECGPLMESVGNVGGQWRALSATNISATPLAPFPELDERLRFKLQLAADAALRRMEEHMLSLQSVRDSVSNQLSAVLQLWDQLSAVVEPPALTQREAAAPSVVDMLEWLQDAERHYRRQLLTRKCLLQKLRGDEPLLLESAPASWVALMRPDEEQNISDSLCKVSFFLEAG